MAKQPRGELALTDATKGEEDARVQERGIGAKISLSACSRSDLIYDRDRVGRVYQQTFIDTYAKVACAKLYDRKTPITAADLQSRG